MAWLNEPPIWQVDGSTITLTAAGKTDFWRKTHDGGVRDSGHFYYQAVTGDFDVTARFSGDYAALYDQAGLMVRLDETIWLKCGIELFNGVQQASAVVTRETSDWSVVPLPSAPPAITFRVKRRGSTIEVHYTLPGGAETLLRQATLTDAPTMHAGVMSCAPIGDGFASRFEDFQIQPVSE